MGNVINLFGSNSKRAQKTALESSQAAQYGINLHMTEGQFYSYEEVGIGIEIALMINKNFEDAQYLLTKMQDSLNARAERVYFDLVETRKYLDYLDIINSPRNKELMFALSNYKRVN
jgi:hypothetical protein